MNSHTFVGQEYQSNGEFVPQEYSFDQLTDGSWEIKRGGSHWMNLDATYELLHVKYVSTTQKPALHVVSAVTVAFVQPIYHVSTSLFLFPKSLDMK